MSDKTYVTPNSGTTFGDPAKVSVAVVGLTTLAFLGCSGNNGKKGGGNEPTKDRLNAGGATFIYPMMSKWASEYKKAKGTEVNYQSD